MSMLPSESNSSTFVRDLSSLIFSILLNLAVVTSQSDIINFYLYARLVHKHINVVYHFPIFFFKIFLTTHLPPATTLILCSLPKLLRRAICTHCILIPSTYSFFNPFQSGFCPHLSTETVLSKVTSDLHIANSVVNSQLPHSKHQQHLKQLFALLS